FLHGLPPAIECDTDHLAAEALDCVDLRAWCVVGNDDRRRHAELAGEPADTLGHVPGAGREDAAGDVLGGRLADRVGGAADLEGADRLQALELQPHLAVCDVDRELHERRPDRVARDHLAGTLDLRERDQNSTSTPTPRSRARVTTSSADARSSTAIPSDLKT